MRTLLLVLLLCLAYGARGDEKKPSVGDRLKSDVKSAGKGVAKSAKDVGKQIGAGTGKAVKGIKAKAKSDIKQGTPGDGSARRRNETLDTAKKGRK
jgi:TPP-dependent pyruvate/acetoin dehydrogenase alpha subunit